MVFAVQPRPTHRHGLKGAQERGVKKKKLAECEQRKRYHKLNKLFYAYRMYSSKDIPNVPGICFQHCLHQR